MARVSRRGFVGQVVYDATHGVSVNNQIRVLDQVRFPAWPDLVAYLDEIAGDEMGSAV